MKVTLVLATTTTPLPDGVNFGFYRFKVSGQDDVDTQQTTVEYDIAAGTACDASVQAYAADGAPLGFVSVGFTVPSEDVPPAPPPRTYEAPSALTVTFG